MTRFKENVITTVTNPITIIWQGILLIPIVGALDSKRGQDIMEAMLEKIVDTQSKTIILDILGVATVDSAVANHLVKITKATKLMGCECIISGIVPSVAQTLVHLGIDLGEVITRATLKDALELAFKMNNFEVKEGKDAVIRKV